MQLRPYQIEGINKIAKNIGLGIRMQIMQMPTGAGKTITVAGLIHRYKQKFNNRVLMLVHREELLSQSRRALYNGFGIISEIVNADTKYLPHADVFVGMVETANNRLKKNPNYFGDIGLLIIDECHIGSFKKIYEYFPAPTIVVGLSATPISATKKDPMKNQWQDIVPGPDIHELISIGSLVQNETYQLKGIARKEISIKRGEFDNAEMGKIYSKSKNVHNVVSAYEKLCEGKKTIIFNCNIAHSILVNDAFIQAGYPSKHLDGTENIYKRVETLKWYASTPNAILHNIGVLTTGWDEPSVINCIVNRSTMSLPLFLQMTGRASRPYPGKDYFRIIDMGGNITTHGDWSMTRDWYQLFHYPDKPSTGGVAPIRICTNCEGIIPASARICKLCGYEEERITEYDTIAPEFEMIIGRININTMVDHQRDSGHKDISVLFRLCSKTIAALKYRIPDDIISDTLQEDCFAQFEMKVIEWCRITGRKHNAWLKTFSRDIFIKEFDKVIHKAVISDA